MEIDISMYKSYPPFFTNTHCQPSYIIFYFDYYK